MVSKVTVTADAEGRVIGVSDNNPEYGYIRIEQTVTAINENGWLTNTRRSTLIKGKVEDLQNVKYTAGQELPGKIIVKESLTPFNPDYADRELKIAGNTGIVCRYEDQPIYRQTFYTLNENAADELIAHTNADEIREVQRAQKAMDALKMAGKGTHAAAL